MNIFAEIAQLVEHLIEAQGVGSSSLPLSTQNKLHILCSFYFKEMRKKVNLFTFVQT